MRTISAIGERCSVGRIIDFINDWDHMEITHIYIYDPNNNMGSYQLHVCLYVCIDSSEGLYWISNFIREGSI